MSTEKAVPPLPSPWDGESAACFSILASASAKSFSPSSLLLLTPGPKVNVLGIILRNALSCLFCSL